jgi:CelD/BcsL family acetyltransferase involved in cellulose biosynthesis
MLQAETLHPSQMTAADREAWRTLAAAGPANPLLGPDFTDQIGRVRPDALVAIWRGADGAPVAFLPHHRRLRTAHPIGAPLSDYHGVTAAPGFDLARGLTAAGLSAYRYSSMIVPPSPDLTDARQGFLIELDESPEAYLEALRQARPKSFKNYRRLGHKLERDFGPLRIDASRHRPAFDALIDWKRRQLARTGGYDFLRPAWVEALLENLFVMEDPAFGGLMVNLYAGDRLVAGHFGVRAGDIYHPWIASTDPDLADWAPGHVFLMQAIAAMPDLGLRTYDLAPSHEHYKAPYARSSRTVVSGMTFAVGAGRTTEQAWILAGAGRNGLVRRLRRRLEVISVSEPTALGRLQGYAATVTTAARRIRPARDAA